MRNKKNASFDINATRMMSASDRNRIIYGNALGIRWKGEGENFGEKIKNFFSKLGLLFFRTLNVLFITNPLFFWLWLLISPEKMGDFLSSGRFWRTRVGASMKKLSIRTAETILPTGRLFVFMEQLTPDECTVENQVSFFNFCRLNGKNWKLSWFSPEAQKRIWAKFHRYPSVAKQMVAEGYPLSEDEQITLVEESRYDLIEKYSEHKTLSTRVLKELYCSRLPKGKELFFSLIAKNGSNEITADMVAAPDRHLLLSALREHSQVVLVRRSRDEEDKKVFFNLAKSEPLYLRAQMELSLEQYSILHSLCKNLSKEVILLKADPKKNPNWRSWVSKFLTWENINFPEWELLLLRTPELREFVLRGGTEGN